MTDETKAGVIKRLTDNGFTTSYCALLFLTAYLGPDPEALNPKNDEERFVWQGHFHGLRAALVCIVRHEKGLDEDATALIVGHHIAEAIHVLGRPSGAG